MNEESVLYLTYLPDNLTNFLNANKCILVIICLIKLKSNSIQDILQILPLKTTFSLTVLDFYEYSKKYSHTLNAIFQTVDSACPGPEIALIRHQQ